MNSSGNQIYREDRLKQKLSAYFHAPYYVPTHLSEQQNGIHDYGNRRNTGVGLALPSVFAERLSRVSSTFSPAAQ